MCELLKDLTLPVLVFILTTLALLAAHYAPYQNEYENCVDDVAFRRDYLGTRYTYLEVIKWCTKHQDDWQKLVRLHNYDIRTNGVSKQPF